MKYKVWVLSVHFLFQLWKDSTRKAAGTSVGLLSREGTWVHQVWSVPIFIHSWNQPRWKSLCSHFWVSFLLMQSFEASQLVIIIINEKFNIIHGFSDVNNRKWCILFSLDLLKQVWKLVLLRLVVNVCSIFPNLQRHYVMDICKVQFGGLCFIMWQQQLELKRKKHWVSTCIFKIKTKRQIYLLKLSAAYARWDWEGTQNIQVTPILDWNTVICIIRTWIFDRASIDMTWNVALNVEQSL